MPEHAAEFEWRGEGDEAGVAVYAPDAAAAESALKRVLPVASLPNTESPVYVAASNVSFGWVFASTGYAVPDVFSPPECGLLLIAGTPVSALGSAVDELPRLIGRRLSEISLPQLGGRAVREMFELGVLQAAEAGLIEEEALALFGRHNGDPDVIPRRAVSEGWRELTLPAAFDVFEVGELADSGAAERISVEPGALALVVRIGTGEAGRITLAAHRERILSRVLRGEFDGATRELPAAPLETEEAADLISAAGSIANFAEARAALATYALRQVLAEEVGELALRAAWLVGGLEERGETLLHRRRLAAAGAGNSFVSGSTVAAGTGNMLCSVPVFTSFTVETGRDVWEEAGVLERVAELKELSAER